MDKPKTKYNSPLNYMSSQIKAKRRLAKRISPNTEIYKELFEQIAICEQLGRPLSKTQIKEFVQLSVVQMLNKIRTHKLA